MRTTSATTRGAVIGALALGFLLVPNHRNATVAFAQGQAADQQSESAAIDRMMRAYADAYGRGDTAAIVQHYYNAPLMLNFPSGVKVLSTETEVERYYV